MKCLIKIISTLLLLLPTLTFAGWQVAKPDGGVSNDPFFQAGGQQDTNFAPSSSNSAFPNQFANLGTPAAVYAISVSGSLKENLERIMDRYHWRVVWKAPYDYNFDGRISGTSLPNTIEKLLKPFPLQATMYMSNRTMIVASRKG